jgi:hypothetical protein
MKKLALSVAGIAVAATMFVAAPAMAQVGVYVGPGGVGVDVGPPAYAPHGYGYGPYRGRDYGYRRW